MSRQRYNNLSSAGHTTLGIPLAGLSVPIGCLNPYACGPITFDGGHTWFDPTNGQQLIQTVQPRVHVSAVQDRLQVDMYGNVIRVSRSVYQPSQHLAICQQPAPCQQPVPCQQSYAQQPQQQSYAQQPQQWHPSICETGHKDQFSGKELITFKGVQCYPPNGKRDYIYNSNRTSVTFVVTEPNGAMWSKTFDI